MSIAIINMTQNKNNFEDDFCENLKSKLTDCPKIIKTDFSNIESIINSNLDLSDDVIILVAHGNKDGNIDMGFPIINKANETNILNKPIIFEKIFNNDKNFIIIFCVCMSFNCESTEIFPNLDKFIGSVSCNTTIGENNLEQIVDIATHLNILVKSEKTASNEYENIIKTINENKL